MALKKMLQLMRFQSVPEEPWQIQVCISFRSDFQSNQLSMGPEGIQRVLWRESTREMEGARCNRIGKAVERPSRLAHRRGQSPYDTSYAPEIEIDETYRGLGIISINRVNCYQKTSSRRQKRPETTKTSTYECSQVMTTVTTSFQHLPVTTSLMPQSFCWPSKLTKCSLSSRGVSLRLQKRFCLQGKVIDFGWRVYKYRHESCSL